MHFLYTLLALAMVLSMLLCLREVILWHKSPKRWMNYAGALFFGLGALVFADAALAQAATSAPATNVVPWGDWIGHALKGSGSIFFLVASYVVHRYAPPFVQGFVTDKAIQNGVDWAIAMTVDATHGKLASIPVVNSVIGKTEQWMIDNEPRAAAWAGDKLIPMITAKVAAAGIVPPEASAASLAK